MARQGNLFAAADQAGITSVHPAPSWPLLADQLLSWQRRLAEHQGPLFTASTQTPEAIAQGQLFATPGAAQAAEEPPLINPLSLRPQPLSFWRWPTAAVHGAALYFVLDRPAALTHPLLLYVGETAKAEQRWKGEHDCKAYLAAYGEALQRSALSPRLSIGFWSDVPSQSRQRRHLEQRLIRHWLPPFNKENRGRWATPFQA